MSFGDVRSLLQQAPTKERWARLCALLDAFDVHQLDALLFPYVEGNTRRWPFEYCVAPNEWVLRAIEGDDLPFWSVVRAVDMSCLYVGVDKVLTFLASDRLGHVRWLNLNHNRLGVEGVHVLLGSSVMARIERLDLAYNGIGAQGAKALAGTLQASALKYVDLSNNDVGSGVVALSDASWMRGLKVLNLRDNAIQAPDMARFIEQMPCLKLERLVLDRNHVGMFGVEALSNRSDLAKLRVLELKMCGLGGRGLNMLANWEGLACVEVLDVSSNTWSADALKMLVMSPYAHHVRKLYVSNPAMSFEEIKDVLMEHRLERLEYIEVRTKTNSLHNQYEYDAFHRVEELSVLFDEDVVVIA